ncbi:unnamed protein product [Mytilus coruscus]|uniref:Uncharacterized protein n=1 Tax=Mytilus coruscus TaxID=42192 RepID=A0A6J8DMH2_MYTCO|nr:unnamed protein product [Mytilus coruscus]
MEYGVKIKGSVILPYGHLLMANYTESNYLTECSYTGEHIRNIPVSGPPFDIGLIDSNSIVVKYGEMQYLEIMNNITFEVETKNELQDHCMGVSHKDSKLYIVCGYYTIQVLDISSRKLETWKTVSENLFDYYDITTSKDKIFYTEMLENIIYCCRMNGEELWQFESESIIGPCSIAVDDDDNVYIVGNTSNNLTIIQHNGKDSKILLSESDGLYEPRTVYYDKETKTILICRQDGWQVWLYKVV